MDPFVKVVAVILYPRRKQITEGLVKLHVKSLCQALYYIASFEMYFDSGICKNCHGNEKKKPLQCSIYICCFHLVMCRFLSIFVHLYHHFLCPNFRLSVCTGAKW